MSDPDPTELFAALAELARRYPHWRVGQLVANVAGWADAEVWDAEDHDLLAAARQHLATPREPTTGLPSAGFSIADRLASPATSSTQ